MIRNVYVLTCTLIGWIRGVESKKNPVCFEALTSYDLDEIVRLFNNRLQDYNAQLILNEEYEDGEIEILAVGKHQDENTKVTIQVTTTIMQ